MDQQVLDDLAAALVESDDDVLVHDVSVPLADKPTWIWVRWMHRHDRSNVLGHSTLVWSGETLHWPSLWVPRAGTLTMLAGRMPEFWRQHGVKRFTALGIGAWTWKYLEAVGFQPLGHQDWLTEQWYVENDVSPGWREESETPMFWVPLDPDPCRLEDYSAWKSGKIDEPGWHKGHNFRRSTEA